MVDRICIFEDQYYRRLLPLTYTRPVYELRCGITTLEQKIRRQYPGRVVLLHARAYLAGLVRQRNPGTKVNEIDGEGCLFLNGRLCESEGLARTFPLEGQDTVFVQGETLVAARVSGGSLKNLRSSLPDTLTPAAFGNAAKAESRARLIGYPWDIINRNGEEIATDFRILAPDTEHRLSGTIYQGSHLVNPDNIVVGRGSRIKPGVVLDAENGPVFIGSDVTVFPNAVIEGPAYVGDRTLIKIGAKIYENTSIGEVCKVGGEVEASVIHSYSNKQHDGFLGHAYLGMWVNLGADTNNSDLKNNYGTVKVVIDGEAVDSGSMFMGLVMGDHSKSSINSMFNTGTVVGVSSNVFGTGFPPKTIPSFAWGGADAMTTYDLSRALEVARRVMGRRKIELTSVEEAALRTGFELTKKERTAIGLAG